ncbi:tetratricopeptide repeat-containing sensor histidine kinase [Flavobacterium gawalongense]|uniref:histidine kinase n=1 Tax=Flavobacterium gawalongense TaxID=2594432 RepID=A0A553BBJ8_9FLAO|nr:ATP-binding protein [Flavobacterium gawalongense]TRW98000.1 ATP-binding protein [Flavobacterium gawalongense]TRX02499.1 ATP-binding protein [Flavobacterium gawalongense]TRX05618.1 ATP-binding protein [Flavobacterium gawalongense]TRX06501.1 ATP-binding protein [Flavobacterium gawalongense]TRX25043.1 ATP-binding protein [Flavobacterium gawalongense]
MKLKKLNSPFFILYFLLFIGLLSCKKETNITPKPKNDTEYNHYFSLAEKYFENQKNDSAFYYYNKIKSTSDVSTDNEKIIYSLLKMAIIQQNEGDYSSSETTATEAISLFQKDTNPAYKCAIFNLLGINYENLYDYNNAIYYYNQAYNQADNELQKVVLKNNIAVVFMDKEDYLHAIQILLPLTLNKKIPNSDENKARVLDNLGYCYFKIGDSKSLNYMDQSLKIRKQIEDDFGIMASYIHFSEFYKDDNFEKSNSYARMAYQKATEINSVNIRLKSLALLIENSIGNESKKFSMLHLLINDSINKVRQKAKNQFAKMKYDSKKEKEENLKLKAQKAENALQLEQQKNRNQLLYFAVGIIILISIFISHFLITKSKREKIKISYDTEIRIAKKLHDELANDVYHTMAFAETQDLSNSQNKEKLLTNLDTIYSRTRNISKENSTIETGSLFISNLKDMMSGFNTNEVNILTNGIDTINWATLESNKKTTVYRVLQELLVNMKKHSQCSIVILTFKKNENKLQIDYTDNGVGAAFDEKKSKNGLQNVENRIQAIKGTTTFDTKSNKGFKVKIIFPI